MLLVLTKGSNNASVQTIRRKGLVIKYNGESSETNTPEFWYNRNKIESDLMGDHEDP